MQPIGEYLLGYRQTFADFKVGQSMRQRADWMTPMDDQILELLQSAGIVLTPSIIAYNLDLSREGVTRRLQELTSYGLVRRVERGKYEITEDGAAYLIGDLDASQQEDEYENN
jgi:predicted transcriptional regulator